MERDFMGLNSKEEDIQAAAVSLKSSAVHWSLSNDHKSQNNHHLEENQKSIDPHGSVQLTIFYKGMVNVYNDMSPEKAEAIMLFAGNGARAQAHVATPTTPAGDVIHVGQPMNRTLSSPVSVGPSTCMGSSSTMAIEAPKVMSSFRNVMQSAVPQMRGASLARFLEKRRERVMASAPYSSKTESSSIPSKHGDKK